MATLAVRNVVHDVVLGLPRGDLDAMVSPLSGRPAERVPLVRIFGRDADGRRACLFLHGVRCARDDPDPDHR
jgi:hypothetical protein